MFFLDLFCCSTTGTLDFEPSWTDFIGLLKKESLHYIVLGYLMQDFNIQFFLYHIGNDPMVGKTIGNILANFA